MWFRNFSVIKRSLNIGVLSIMLFQSTAPVLANVDLPQNTEKGNLINAQANEFALIDPVPETNSTSLPTARQPQYPPGTLTKGSSGPFTLYLPMVVNGGTSKTQEIALSPDVWIEETEDWLVFEQNSVSLQYPNDSSLTKDSETSGNAWIDIGKNQTVHVEFLEKHEGEESPNLAKENRIVKEISFKGLSSWQILPEESKADFCESVIIPGPNSWVSITLEGKDPEACEDRGVFNLILSSVQYVVNENPPGDVSETDPTEPQGMISPMTMVTYDRNAAYNYAAYYGTRSTNDDGYFITGADGGHYLAHFLQAGGFPIHWNVGQNNSDPIVINMASQRNYVLNSGYAWVTSANSLSVGDTIYMLRNGSWCWGSGVVRMSSGVPYASGHTANYFNVRYDLYSCGTGTSYQFVHVDARTDHPADPQLNSGLYLTPSAQLTNSNVTASFNVHNYGGLTSNISLRVTTNGGGDFSTTSCSISSEGDCYYSQTRSFSTAGNYTTCAQMNSGSGWVNLPATGAGVACRTLSIVPPTTTDTKLNTSLQLSPNELPYPGGNVQSTFNVINTGSFTPTERFRARVTNGSVTFAETGNISLSPGGTYAYNQSGNFTTPGVYEVIAEHLVNGSWYALLSTSGTGSGFIRVLAPPPPPEEENKGNPKGGGYAGDPVNTSTGNYVTDFADLSTPLPELSLQVTRWYNSLDAGQVVGPFGYGTSWLYGMKINWRPDKTATIRMADGHTAYFVGTVNSASPLDMSGAYTSQGDDVATLVRAADNSAKLTFADHTVFSFSADGLLARISRPDSTSVTISYSGEKPVTITHSGGVSYSITYSGSYIGSITSSLGQSVSYSYSAESDLHLVTRSDGSTYTYLYDNNHRLVEARDPNNHMYVRNVYDAKGRVVTQYDQTGARSDFAYDDPLKTRTYEDALGNQLTHVYNADGRLVKETDARGHSTFYTYDQRGNVLTYKDQNGQVWQNTYDSSGNKLTEKDPLGNTWVYTYDVRNNRISQKDPFGKIWIYSYDGNDRLTSVTDPLGYSYRYAYDTAGNIQWEEDQNGARTYYQYNSLGLPTQITDPLGQNTHIAYDAFGNRTSYTDANGHTATFAYDSLHRLISSTDPTGAVTTYSYDAMGNLLSETNSMGQTRTYTYDDYDQLLAETDFNGNLTQYAYDVVGRLTVVTDSAGASISYTYDGVGSRTSQTDKDGGVTTYEYDPTGRLIKEIDPLGKGTIYFYDAAGRQTEIHRSCDACQGGVAISRSAYDAAGRIIKITDPRGAVTQFSYDVLGRKAIETDPAGHTKTYTYDPAGSVIQETDALSRVANHSYDLTGNLISSTNALGGQITYQYDSVGNVISVTNERGFTSEQEYDANDRLVNVTDALGYTVAMTYDTAGNLLTTTVPSGSQTMNTYDANGNLLTVTDPRGGVTRYEYDNMNRAVRITDPLGNNTYTVYDVMGRVISQTDALGNTVSFTYDLGGRKLTETSPLGNKTTHIYDNSNNLISRTDPTGATWHFGYDANGNQVRTTDPLGSDFITEYNLLNQPVRQTDPLGAVFQTTYDAAGQVIAVIDPRGATTRTVYDALGRAVEAIGPMGDTYSYTYDEGGNLLSVRNPIGSTITYTYDALNQVIAEVDVLGGTRTTQYDSSGWVISRTDPNGNTTSYAYDASGNCTQTTAPDGGVSRVVYDELNRPISRTDAIGRTWSYVYNALGQVVSETSPSGLITSTTYDAEGHAVQLTDAQGNVWQSVYDSAGQLIQTTDPLGHVQTTDYDPLGLPIATTDALNRTTRYSYDQLGRLITITAPGGITQLYSYDLNNNVLAEQDGNGHQTRYEYDLNNRVIRKTNALNKTWRYKYDAAGNLTATLDPDGEMITHTYDALGRIIGKAYDSVQQVEFTYDANGNRASMTDTIGTTTFAYDQVGRLINSVDPAGHSVTYEYDYAGQQVALTYPDGMIAQFEYNLEGLLIRTYTPNTGESHYEYNELRQICLTTQPNGVTVSYAYDAVGNITHLKQETASGVSFTEEQYTYDVVDRRVQVVEISPQQSVTTTFEYDDLDRLISSTSTDDTRTGYTYDAAGNRITQMGRRIIGDNVDSYMRSFEYNAANQLTDMLDSAFGQAKYYYDASGNRIGMQTPELKVEYDYNPEGRLIEARKYTPGDAQWEPDEMYERYIYDGLGRRVLQASLETETDTAVYSQSTMYDNNTQWNELAVYENGVELSQVNFLNDGFLHKAAFWTADQVGFFQNDGLGSVVGTTDAAGELSGDELIRYGDFGEANHFEDSLITGDSFTGYTWDNYLGLYYARNRYYDPDAGVFVSSDPYPANRKDMLDLNRYTYVQSDPINNTDPLGLFKWTGSASGIIERGDSLWGISAAYWGVSPQNVNWGMIQAILAVNPSIKDPGLIYAGSTLRLPSPLSAYSYLTNASQSTNLMGTSGSDCGVHNGSGGGVGSGGNNSTSNGGNNSGSGGSGSSGGGGGGGGGGGISDEITITENYRSSPYWDIFNTLTKLEFKDKFKKYSLSIPETGKVSVYIPPIPPAFSGGTLRWQFKFETYIKVFWNKSLADPKCQKSGWCGVFGASVKLEVEIPLVGPLNFGVWGKVSGEIGACLAARWVSQNILQLYLEPYGKLGGEVGAKIYIGGDGFLGFKKLEAGLEAVFKAEATFTSMGIWFEAGPYAEVEMKVWGWDFKTEWRGIRYKSPGLRKSYSQLTGGGGW